MFVAFLKALPQFLPFLLTLLRGDKAPMSGEQSKTGKRVAFLFAGLSIIATLLLYLDHNSLVKENQNNVKKIAEQKAEIDKMLLEGVEGAESRRRMQAIKEETLMAEAKVSQKEAAITTLNNTIATLQSEKEALVLKVTELEGGLSAAQGQLMEWEKNAELQCEVAQNPVTPTPKPAANDDFSDFLNELNQIGKKDGK